MNANHNADFLSQELGKPPQRQLKRTTFIVLLSVLLLFGFSTGISIWSQHQHATEKIEQEVQTASQRLEHWIQYPLRFFDSLPLNTLANSSVNESKFFNQIINRSNRFYHVKLVDSNANTVRSFGPTVKNEPADTWSNAPPTKSGFLQFGRSFFEPEINNWLLPVRHLQPIGQDQLSAIAYMDGRAFEAIFKSLHPSGEGSLSLFRQDGLMLARIPFADKLVGKSFSNSALFSNIIPTQPNGVSRAPKKTDGIERIVAHRSLNAYPLVITVGLDLTPALQGSVGAFLLQYLGFLGVFIVSLALAFVLWQQVKAMEETQNTLVKTQEELQRLASLDSLTGCFNRRAFLRKAEIERGRYQRNGRPFSCVMIDLDHFKDLNDTYGHLQGDEVLVQFSNHCKKGLRSMDFIGRYGGEEFMVILPETSLGPAIEVADRLRHDLNHNGLKLKEQNIPLTFSAGVATIMHPDETLQELIKRADDALYKAKEKGRNQVMADQNDRFV